MENQSLTIPLPEEPQMANSSQTAIREAWLKEGQAAWADYQRTGLHLTNNEVLDWMDKIADGENAPMPKCHT